MVVFHVVDARNQKMCQLMALLFDDVWCSTGDDDESDVHVSINCAPYDEHGMVIIDSWGLYEEFPNAHPIPKNDYVQKIRRIMEIVDIPVDPSEYAKVDTSCVYLPGHMKHLVDLFPGTRIVVSNDLTTFKEHTDSYVARCIFYTVASATFDGSPNVL